MANELGGLNFITGAKAPPNTTFLTCGSIKKRMAEDHTPTTATLAQAITFKNAVARELEKAGITYRRDFCDGIASADFLIERARARIAFECKFNVGRDFEKTLGIARLLLSLLRCDRVVVIVPFREEAWAASISEHPQISISTPLEAVQALLA